MPEPSAPRHADPGADDIAVVGAGCRFPGGVRSLEALWRVLLDGTDVVTEVPPDRWNGDFHDPDPRTPGAAYSRAGGFLEDIDRFDAEFFEISPREAREMDPQQRLLLEVSHEAMEDAGRPRESWYGSRTSVFMGVLGSDYLTLHTKAAGTRAIDPYYATGKEFSFGVGRISYTFGLQGPAMAVNTACSSSLVAVHLACQSLRSGESDTALAGGVNVIVTPELTVFMSKVQALSPTGRCRPFDAKADGVVRGEGCGVVVLKRLADAVRDHDRILGVIRGSAVNQDGHSAGLTVPNARAQQALLTEALERAGLSAGQPAYVEAHGTGTPLGDPLELSSLAAVYGRGREGERALLVGSHKANFGHMDSAAGIAGLLKTLLVLQRRTVPPQIHFTSAPALDEGAEQGIAVPTTAVPLGRAHMSDGSLFAGVSAFGLSGTNAHVLLSGPPAAAPQDSGDGASEPGAPRPHTLLLSATTGEGLRALAGDYARLLDDAPGTTEGRERPDPARLAAAAAVRRTHARHRLAVVGEEPAELAAALRAFHAEVPDQAHATGRAAEQRPRVVYVFSGQGSQWPGMGVRLYGSEPVVRETLDECDALIREHAGWSLLDVLRDDDPARLRATRFAQPAVFALQTALARLWRSWGVGPDAVVGHSMGEVAAACCSGALTLHDAVPLIVHRGLLMQRATGSGGMLAVGMAAEEADAFLDGHPEVSLATVNGPRSVVLAGPAPALATAADALRAQGVDPVPLPVDYAFHTPLMRPYAEELEAAVAGLRPGDHAVRFLSTAVAGAEPPPLDAAYWGRNVREPVLFWPAVDALLAGRDERGDEEGVAFVEIGAHPVLGHPLREALTRRGRTGVVVGSLIRGTRERTALARHRAQLHVAGVRVDWSAVYGGPVSPVSLPPPRWADERYWLPGVVRGSQSGAVRPVDGQGAVRAEVRLFDARGRLVGEAVTTPPVPGREPVSTPTARGTTEQPGTELHGRELPAAESAAAGGSPAAAADAPDRERVAATVQERLAVVLGHAADKRLPRTRGFQELGVDSLSAVELASQVRAALGCEVDAADVLAYATVDALTDHVLPRLPSRPPVPVPASNALFSAVAPAAAHLTASTAGPPPAAGPEPVAIVGLGCRLPGADGPEEFWRLLSERGDATGEVPPQRWDAVALAAAGGEQRPGTTVTTRGAFLDRVDGFDHGFFRVSPREARSMDPQQRLFLEVAWEALDDAGLTADRLRDSSTGVFVGLNTTDYQQLVTSRQQDVDLYYGTGNSFSGTAGRLSYFLGARGPSMAVDTACSSSLTAVHLACQSLRSGESETAVAGGVNVMSTPTVFLAMSAAGALAPDGRCKTFDDSADGYGRGEGAGAVVLKTLSAALRDGDRVYAVIRGSAVNQDGASGGLTVPSGQAQEDVVRAALAQAGAASRDVSYVEAHGTGTRLGDAIELRALAAALGEGRSPGTGGEAGGEPPLVVGSVKTNVGHLEAAAGITGLIKTVLALGHRSIPPHLHYSRPTRQLDWDRLPLRVAAESVPWRRNGRPRLAGVSAFGFTGTNAHVVVEEAPEPPRPAARPRAGRPLVLAASAATPAALREAAARLHRRLESVPDAALADLCWTSGARRTHHEHRLAVVGADRRELAAGLAAAREEPTGSVRAAGARGVYVGTARPGERRGLAFAYGHALPALPWAEFAVLVEGDPAVRAVVDELDGAVRDAFGFSPVQVWREGSDGTESVALAFAGHVVRTALLAAYGVTPDVTAGHGAGGPAAGYSAGELDLTAAVRLLAEGASGRHERSMPDGAEVVLDFGFGAPHDTGKQYEYVPAPAGARDLAEAAAALHVHGCRVDWDQLVPGDHRVTTLPAYPWQRRRHWIAPEPVVAGVAPAPGLSAAPANGTAAATASNGAAGNGAAVDAAAANAAAANSAPSNGAAANAAPSNGASAAAQAKGASAAAQANGTAAATASNGTAAATASNGAPANSASANGASATAQANGAAAATPANGAQAKGTPAGDGLVARLAAAGPQARTDLLIDALLDLASDVLGGVDDLTPDQGFFELGMDSVLSAQFKVRTERALSVELPDTVMFECPNVRSFARFILDDVLAPVPVPAPAGAPYVDGADNADVTDNTDGAGADGLNTLTDDELVGRLLSAVADSESMLAEGDRS
ncbi:beta-ketoacyl synthase N-terminal-like domain-containing protein [Streptomyces sp. NPDC050704]|uniref:beta-ketoacyl synthase N-terminal-like domain-containing protein n=1 Tax=Streptomyces sp. NPDC050704 TaxID=3157219 RepID=UPI003412674A